MEHQGAADPHLRALIGEEIEAKGPMDVARFMELALYHPDWGYYSCREKTFDYYTNVDVHPVYAELLAHYFHNRWKQKFPGQKIRLIELGAGSGVLARKILDACRKYPDFYHSLTYVAVETSARRREAAAALSDVHPAFRIQAEFDFPEASIEGFVFSNEFFDALPVRRVAVQGGKLKEIFLNPSLKESWLDPSAEAARYFEWLGVPPAEGCKAEAHPAARAWMERIGRSIKSGLVITIDYGLSALELYSELRSEGTLLAHFRHAANRDFYSRIGEQDLTSHANFTALIRAGEEQGLRQRSFQTQSDFLLENGAGEMAEAVRRETDPIAQFKASAAVKSLIHPEGMGGTFKVLVQEK